MVIGGAGLALLAGFFLPWIDLGGPLRASGFDAIRGTSGWSFYELVMLFVPIGGALMLGLAAANKPQARGVSMLVGFGLGLYGVYKIVDAFFSVTGWGLWIVILATIVAAFAPLFMASRTSK
jgi:hypothetical protein